MVPSATVVVHGPLVERALPGLVSLSPRLHVRWGTDSAKHAVRPEGTVSLDGAAIVQAQLVTTGSAAADLWGGRELGGFAQWWGRMATQSACLYIWDRARQQFAILPDPLGGATLFRHEHGDISVISTDYRELIATAAHLGFPLEKDPEYQVERMLFGAGGLRPTSYLGGQRIPSFTGVMLDDRILWTVPYESRAALTEQRSYINSVNLLRRDTLDAVSALAEAPAQARVAHLTGGFDSRMVLGAILAAGCRDGFEFFCSGPESSIDRQVADGLARTFDLTRTTSSGLRPVVVGTAPEQDLAQLRYTAGLSTVGPTGLEEKVDVLSAGGGYGELMRSFYTTSLLPTDSARWADGRTLLQAMVGRQVDVEDLISREILESLGRQLTETLHEIRASGVPADLAPNVYYSDVRNRYHMGGTTLLWSRVGTRVNPLYSVHSLAAARELTAIAREANVLGYDLLESFGHRLSQYPFDSSRSTPEYRRQRRPRPTRAFTDGEVRYGTKVTSVPPPGRTDGAVPSKPDTPQRREEVLARAKALSLIFWQSNHLEETQAALAASLEAGRSDSLAHAFNIDYVRELARTTRWNRTRVRHLYAITSIVQWLADEPPRPAIVPCTAAGSR
ncbi:hypothetical protein [Janibacter sp. DB-40]|uniref:hypothetical protein n=1 Tax=Janibacter sp. DB-40 TaxID=3028808 RepID=UPI002405C065|nr:hypothetical protein [Janibacter sp. DB-40]